LGSSDTELNIFTYSSFVLRILFILGVDMRMDDLSTVLCLQYFVN
jgi:hypothetical protein